MMYQSWFPRLSCAKQVNESENLPSSAKCSKGGHCSQGIIRMHMYLLILSSQPFAFFSGSQRVIAAATIGALASLAPTLGPTVGRWITDHYSWHWLFFINLIPGLFVTIAVPMLVRIDRPDFSLLRGADYLGMALMAIFLGSLEYTLEEGPR